MKKHAIILYYNGKKKPPQMWMNFIWMRKEICTFKQYERNSKIFLKIDIGKAWFWNSIIFTKWTLLEVNTLNACVFHTIVYYYIIIGSKSNIKSIDCFVLYIDY